MHYTVHIKKATEKRKKLNEHYIRNKAQVYHILIQTI